MSRLSAGFPQNKGLVCDSKGGGGGLFWFIFTGIGMCIDTGMCTVWAGHDYLYLLLVLVKHVLVVLVKHVLVVILYRFKNTEVIFLRKHVIVAYPLREVIFLRKILWCGTKIMCKNDNRIKKSSASCSLTIEYR